MRENLNILYNAFGYYVQFIPVVLKHVENGRKNIEKELKECLKLFNWEHSSTENFRRTRQKIWKLVKKFNDLLQQPVMIILNQDATQKRENDPSWLDQKITDENNMDVVQFPLDLVQLSHTERFLWCGEWKMKADSAVQCKLYGNTSAVGLLQNKEIADPIRQFLSSEFMRENFMAGWKEGWNSIENICRHAAEFAHLWKHGTRNLEKRRALSNLLKTLEKCGLSRHRSMVFELELKAGHANNLFLQPSYDVIHLLQSDFCPSKDPNVHLPGYSQKPADDKCALAWVAANKSYFKNLGMVQQLRQVSLNFKKDLSLEQVNRAASFVDHLIIIQQEQRCAAYCVSEQLQKLRQQFHCLSSIETDNGCYLAPHQRALLNCMWQQKSLFDKFLAMSKDVQLLLLRINDGHKNTCKVVRAEVDMVSELIDKFIPIFLQSKGSLDKYLLGGDGAVTTSVTCVSFIVSKPMEELVTLNFDILNTFEKDIKTLRMQKGSRLCVKETLLKRLEDLIVEGKIVIGNFNSELEASNQSDFEEHLFNGIVEEINELLKDVFGKLDFIWQEHMTVGELSAENITLWKTIFESYVGRLHFGSIYDSLSKIIVSVSKLVNCVPTGKPDICVQIDIHLKRLHASLELLLTFGEGLLSEFLDAHKTLQVAD